MSIDKKTRAEVLRLYYAEKWRIGTIAGQLGVHHNTVDRVRDIAVRDHDLTEYDGLAGEPEEDSEE